MKYYFAKSEDRNDLKLVIKEVERNHIFYRAEVSTEMTESFGVAYWWVLFSMLALE